MNVLTILWGVAVGGIAYAITRAKPLKKLFTPISAGFFIGAAVLWAVKDIIIEALTGAAGVEKSSFLDSIACFLGDESSCADSSGYVADEGEKENKTFWDSAKDTAEDVVDFLVFWN